MEQKTDNASAQVYLDQRLAKPGDVLLQLGKGAESTAIALVTKSRFSHATVLIAATMMYEALDDGVLPTSLLFAAVQPPAGPVRLALAMNGVRDAVLVRHTALESEVDERRYDVADKFIEELGKFAGKPYAATRDVLCAAPPGSALRALGGWLRANLRNDHLDPRQHGIFCSELVARTYAALGVPLFAESIVPGTVSPGDLHRSPFLREVPNAVFRAQAATPTPEMARSIKEASDALPTRERHAGFFKSQKEIEERSPGA